MRRCGSQDRSTPIDRAQRSGDPIQLPTMNEGIVPGLPWIKTQWLDRHVVDRICIG